MPNGIRCMIEECAYNQQKSCTANNIEVRSSGSMSVSTSEATCCETFVPKQ